MPAPEACFLFDNGSLRPAPTRGLRAVAERLERKIGCPVKPVSLLHSNAVPAALLGGCSAELLEAALGTALAGGMQTAVLVPLFFGPSAALTEYLPDRMRRLAAAYPEASVRLARCVVQIADSNDWRIARILASRIVAACGSNPPEKRWQVVLVDHGSPQPAVTEVRNHLARQVAKLLGDRVGGVHAASMERRPGAEYAFNDPLLADRLRQAPCNEGKVIVARQFFFPGRHGGPGGDIEEICEAASRESRSLDVVLTEPVGEDDLLVDVLADRFHERC